MAKQLPPLLRRLDDLKLTVRGPITIKYRLGEFERYYLDLSSWRLRFNDLNTVVHISLPEQSIGSTQEVADALWDFVLERNLHHMIVLVDGDAAVIKERLSRRPDHSEIVVIGSEEQETLVSWPGTAERFRHTVTSQMPIGALAPYETDAFVSGARFFGRAYESRFITSRSDKSHIIIGIRRIGKTSLLREVERKLLAKFRPPDGAPAPDRLVASNVDRILYIDCSNMKSAWEFMEHVVQEIEPNLLPRLHLQNLKFLARVLKSARDRIGHPLVLIMDEIDDLIIADKGNWDLFNTLRGLAQARPSICQFVFAGHREARKALYLENSPFYNFTQTVRLEPFTKEDAELLICQPMESLGVRFESRDEVLLRIYNETGGHPNLLQYYCKVMVKHMERSGEHVIRPDSFDGIYNDSEFRERLVTSFLYNTSPTEKLLIYAMVLGRDPAHPGRFTDPMSYEFITESLRSVDVHLTAAQIYDAIALLDLAGVLRQNLNEYFFNFPVFAKVLLEHHPVRQQIEAIKMESL